MELQRSNPNELGSGFYWGRIFVNLQVPDRVYFGDITTAPLFQSIEGGTIDICSTMQSGTKYRDSSLDGYHDMMNLAWFQGDEGLFQDSSGRTFIHCFIKSVSLYSLRRLKLCF